MKKMTAILACVLCAAVVVAGDWFSGRVTLAAGATNGVSADVNIVKMFGGGGCAALDRFTAAITSGTGTGVVYLVSVDQGIETAIANSGTLNTTTLYDVQPKRSFTTTETVGYAVVTGNVVVTGSSVNTVTNKENYFLRSVRVKVIQPAASTATVYDFSLFAK